MDSTTPNKGVSVVLGVGRGGADDVVAADVAIYDFERGGVENTSYELKMIEDKGMLWWPMDELQQLIYSVLGQTNKNTLLSWLMPGADVYAEGQALHYRSLKDRALLNEITERVSPRWIWERQGYAAVQFFQALVQCAAMERAGVNPTQVRMLCDEVEYELRGRRGFPSSSASMRRSNGLDTGEGTRDVFGSAGLASWYREMMIYPPNEDELRVAPTGARYVRPSHDSLPTRWGGAVSDNEDGKPPAKPRVGMIGSGGWNMSTLRLPGGQLAGGENFDQLYELDAAREGLGPEACWVINCACTGDLYKALVSHCEQTFETAAALAGTYGPTNGLLPVVKGMIQTSDLPATPQSLCECMRPNAALAYVLGETVHQLTKGITALSEASGVTLEPGDAFAVTGGFTRNPTFMKWLAEALEKLGLVPEVPRHADTMTTDAGLAKVVAQALEMPFPDALRKVQNVRDGQPAWA